jgi:DNA repair protein RecO (recombination protein O)
MAKFKTITGIVLRHIDYGEAEKLFIMLTPTGKFKAFAKGVRKVTSKNAGHLELFSHAHIQLVEGNSNRHIIGSAMNIEKFDILAEKIECFAIGMFACEYLDIVVTENDEDSYHHLLIILQQLKKAPYNDNFILFALAHLSVCAGIMPSIEECASCGETCNESDIYFSFSSGGMLCEQCKRVDDVQELHIYHVKIIRNMYRQMATPMKYNIPKRHVVFVANLLYKHLTYNLSQKIKTWRMIEDVVLK